MRFAFETITNNATPGQALVLSSLIRSPYPRIIKPLEELRGSDLLCGPLADGLVTKLSEAEQEMIDGIGGALDTIRNRAPP